MSRNPSHSNRDQRSQSNLMYGCLEGHRPRELPPELAPREHAHIHRPCVRLYKSWYGHPETGGHSAKKLHSAATELGGCESTAHPSSYWLEKERLLLTLYVDVDDVVVRGPAQNHDASWKKLGTLLNIELPHLSPACWVVSASLPNQPKRVRLSTACGTLQSLRMELT